MPLQNLTDEQLIEYHTLYQLGMNSSNRFQDVKINKLDSKYLYHLVRLCDECEQILLTGDIDLQRDNERLKAIRRGEWNLERGNEFFAKQEAYLEECYQKSTLPYSPDLLKIKNLLLNCLEEHFGSLDKVITREDKYSSFAQEIKNLLEIYKI